MDNKKCKSFVRINRQNSARSRTVCQYLQAQGATLGQVVQDVAACSTVLKDQELSLSQVVKEVGGLDHN